MRALVTGASGFIGSHLCDLLLARGHQVRGLVRRTSNQQWLQGKDVELCYGELRDRQSLQAAVTGMDWVFHVAATLRPRRIADFLRVNYQGTKVLAQAASAAGVQRFVLFSSAAAGGPAPSPQGQICEEQEPRPVTVYGRGKLRAEQVLIGLRDQLHSVILRFPAVYGPRDRDVLMLLRAIKRGILPEFGGTFSLVYVADAVRAALLAVERPVLSGSVYYISDGACHSYAELAALAGRLLGRRPLRIRVLPWALLAAGWLSERVTSDGAIFNRDKARELAQPCWVCSIAKARQELGYEAEYSLERGMSETFRWYQEQGWL